MESRRSSAGQNSPGLIASLGALAKHGIGLFLSRLELAAIELGELRDNLAKLLLLGALGIVALLFAIGSWTALIVVLAWETMGWKILLLVALLYSMATLAILLYARARLIRNALSLPATMSELRNDRDALL
ncbi:phage holin family protein [Noviherbaspirillum saxi]|uniref:Phage holin family protein n=1 Tax=Noviherbaspirillum saxi TaxID=2320863 RepID=A0A3A3FLW1_9BURK|nr:phage holin family protein [Noviherbaspirillum saxi]RJF97162.1 phage holin family protein [Noviherbaspirillum saxi]